MCNFKSGIITKEGKVFFNEFEFNNDSHSKILEDNNIKDDTQDPEKKRFTRFEFTPPNGEVFADFDKWSLQIDEEVIPKWFTNEKHGKLIKKYCIEWLSERIFIGKKIEVLKDKLFFIKDCKIQSVYGNATIQSVSGNATIQYVSGNATIQSVSGNATIQSVSGNATIQYVYGNATIQSVYGNATIQYVYGNATIQYVYGNATIQYVSGNATIQSVSGNATIQEIEGGCKAVIIYPDKNLIVCPGYKVIKTLKGVK